MIAQAEAQPDLDLKKQISMISFNHDSGQNAANAEEGNDPSAPEFWSDALFDPEGLMEAPLEEELFQEFTKLTML